MNGHSRLDLGQLAELVLAVRGAGPLLAAQPGHGDVAVLVVQRGERAQQHEQRVGCGAAELAAVLRAGERSHLDDHARHPAQRDGERRNAGAEAAHVRRSPSRRRRTARAAWAGRCVKRAADLLLALDHDLDPDRGLPAAGAQRADVHRGCSTSSRRCRGRRSRRRARSPRRAATPISSRRRRARRRSARTAAPSGRPSGAGISPMMTGAVSGRSSESSFSTPASRSSPTISSYVSSSGWRGSGKPAAETDGIATRRASSSSQLRHQRCHAVRDRASFAVTPSSGLAPMSAAIFGPDWVVQRHPEG